MSKQLGITFYFPQQHFMQFAPPLRKRPIRNKATVSIAGSSFRNDAQASGLSNA